MQALLAQPRGFCGGVIRAIEIVERAPEVYRPPVYVFHEIVHNRHVVQDLQRRAAVFVDDVASVPTTFRLPKSLLKPAEAGSQAKGP